MATTFVTGTSQANLAANITAAITGGFLDITIYSVTPAIIGSNLDNLIPNLNLLQALRFSDVSAFPINTFESANFSDLRILTTSNLNSSSFKLTQMNALIELDLSNLTTISGTDHFAVAQINALKTINLPNLTSMAGSAGTFAGAQMNALTSINWPANLPDLPALTFNGTQIPKLPGICLSKNTTFVNNTFLGITQGPSDMKALVSKTHSNLVYASDFYGYACAPLVFNIPVGNSDSVFNIYGYKNFGGSAATGLTVTAVNEGALPATVGSVTIQSNGTIVVNNTGPATFTMRFSAAGSLVGARTIKVNPCFALSNIEASTATSRFSGKGGINIKGLQSYYQHQSDKRTVTVRRSNVFSDEVQSSILSSDGSFVFFFPTSDAFSIQNCSTTLSSTLCQSTFKFILTPARAPKTSLLLSGTGSLFNFHLILPSDFTTVSSDKIVIFSDLCIFAQTQPSDQISAIFQMLENSDLFASDAVIAKGSFDVFVSCSDQCLNINEQNNDFLFKICNFTSDAQIVYSDNNLAHAISDHAITITSIISQASDIIIFESLDITPPTVPCANTLSDVQFFAFSANQFKVTGYQFDDMPTEPRSLSASYLNAPTQTQSFNSDGFFQFIFTDTPIVDGELVTVITQGSDCGFSVATVESQSQAIAQGIVQAGFAGSLLNFNLALPPELAITLPNTSDIHDVFSDMCAFAQIQDCQNFLAGIVINDYSDLFCSDAVIVQRPEIVLVSCSDNILHLDDDDGHFTFSITDFMSDTVLVEYSDSLCQVSDVMSLIGGSFSLQTSDANFIWVTPCDSDQPSTFTNVFNHPILGIDAQGDIVDVGLINCAGPCHNPTSDLLYVSQLKAATLKLGQYLSDHYSDYTSKISDQCHMLYQGPIMAGMVTVDIETVRLIFSNFSIPFSDIDVC
ncbi:MAG: hypothetical protein AAB323_01805 [Pseudomonadota bacterium]